MTWRPDTSIRIEGKVAYDRVRVIDDRRVRSIGFLRTGSLNQYVDLRMEDSVDKSIEEWANRLLRISETSPGELLIVLRDLRIEDRKGNEEIGTVHVRADLFTGQANAYVHYKNTDSLYETKNVWDVTKAVQRMASEALVTLVLQAGNHTQAGDPKHVFTLEEAVARERTFRQSLPVYQVDSPQRGIYATVDDFLQLRPSDTGLMDARYTTRDVPVRTVFYRKTAKGKRGDALNMEHCFAVYNGRNWYIARGSVFWLLHKEESGDYYTTLQMKGLVDNTLMMGVMFGALAATMAAADQGKYYTNYRVRLMPDTRKFAPVGRVR